MFHFLLPQHRGFEHFKCSHFLSYRKVTKITRNTSFKICMFSVAFPCLNKDFEAWQVLVQFVLTSLQHFAPQGSRIADRTIIFLKNSSNYFFLIKPKLKLILATFVLHVLLGLKCLKIKQQLLCSNYSHSFFVKI
jgi:hypothetical protein